MRTAVSTLELIEPRSLAAALAALRDFPGLIPIAGATDLYVDLNHGTLPGTRFLNLWGMPGLRTITMKGDILSLGALATYDDIVRSRLVGRHAPMLAQAAGEIGGVQIRNRGTIGGNVANASPAGDTLPVLAALDAQVVLRSARTERRLAFGAFFTGYRQTARRADELIVALELPPVEGRQWFRKVGTRAAQAISKVVMAAVRAPRPRVALGSVGPTVLRLSRVEAALADGRPLDEVVQLLEADISPIDDVRSTARYRSTVAGNLLRRFWIDTAKP